MKEKILEAFANLGFKLEDADGMGYVFDYEGIRFLYMYNENDENFLSIALPGFHDYDENNAAQYCILEEKISSTLKYVKAYCTTPGAKLPLATIFLSIVTFSLRLRVLTKLNESVFHLLITSDVAAILITLG